MNYQDKNQRSEEELNSKTAEQNENRSQKDISADKNNSYRNNDEEQKPINDAKGSQNGVDEDAPSRLRDEDKEATEPQINSEGEFTSRTGWVREEGLSDKERREAEEEGLDGLRSGDSSAL